MELTNLTSEDLTADNYLSHLKSENCLHNKIDVKSVLPHKYPFLLVDKVIKINKETNFISAIKNVTNNEEFFNGHFPDFPIMPGVLITEALAQVAVILSISHVLNVDKNQVDVRFLAINEARFRKPVFPGDRLYMNVQLLKQKRDIFKFVGRAYTEAGLCTEMEFTAASLIKK